MQFKRRMLDIVLSGEKTETRRLSKPRHKVGSIQPIQCGYRDKARGHIRILKVWRQRLGDVTKAEAKAEGFISPLAFVGYLININPKSVEIMPDTVVTAYRFELVDLMVNGEKQPVCAGCGKPSVGLFGTTPTCQRCYDAYQAGHDEMKRRMDAAHPDGAGA